MKLRFSRSRWPLLALLALGCVMIVGWAVWYRASLRPVDARADRIIEFTVQPGQKAKQIADGLRSQHLIRSRAAFLMFIDLHGVRSRLQSGTYNLKQSYSTPQLVDIMAGGKVARNVITIPEGSTIARISQLASAKGIKPSDFDAAIKATYTNDFLKGKPASVDLEGYLFPDSYDVNSTTTAQSLVKDMLDNFGRKVTPDITAAFQAEGLDLHQGITLASIVEAEVPNETDRRIVAGIFLKRLQAGQMLQSDVTVHYAAAQTGRSFSLSLDSLYNTYLHEGLPPGPINNPGLAAIQAAAHPTATDYLYFVAGTDGVTHYATTFAEHQRNVQRFLK